MVATLNFTHDFIGDARAKVAAALQCVRNVAQEIAPVAGCERCGGLHDGCELLVGEAHHHASLLIDDIRYPDRRWLSIHRRSLHNPKTAAKGLREIMPVGDVAAAARSPTGSTRHVSVHSAEKTRQCAGCAARKRASSAFAAASSRRNAVITGPNSLSIFANSSCSSAA